MIEEKTLISVRNRNNGSTGYSIPDRGIWRNFAIGETKKIPFDELVQLQYQPGGDYVLKNLLIVESDEALKLLNMKTEPEYAYTEKDIQNLLLNGSIDQLKDFFDFAPQGAIEIAKEIAVKEQIPDVRKRKIIFEATGFNIDSAIMVNQIMDEEPAEAQEEKQKTRRVEPVNAAAPSTRRAEPITTAKPATPNYKVVK